MTADFHLLRPWWLLALLPATLLAWRVAAAGDARRAWRGVVADHLLPHLLLDAKGGPRLRPLPWLLGGWALAVVALAGPTWRREPAPFAEDDAVLVIVVKVTPSMSTEDVQPTRQARAAQKVRDLLERRRGARTALVAYAGSAHRVMPLTRDAGIVEAFAAELAPEVMPPVEGDAAAAALRAADAEIVRSGRRGWALWVGDGVAADQLAGLADYRREGRAPVSVLAVAGEGPERDSLQKAAAVLGAAFVDVTADDGDVRRLAANARFSDAGAAGGGERWQDAGYWLTPVLALLSLLWFRPSWMVRTAERGWPHAPVALPLVRHGGGRGGRRGRGRPARLAVGPGRLAHAGPAGRPPDACGPLRRGGAGVPRPGAAGGGAVPRRQVYGGGGGVRPRRQRRGAFDRGNCLVLLGKYADAVTSYDRALALRPGWPEAEDNRAVARVRLERLRREGGDASGGQVKADEVVCDKPKGDRQAPAEEAAGGAPLTDEDLRGTWLRRVQTRPADFLRDKFSYQYQQQRQGAKGP